MGCIERLRRVTARERARELCYTAVIPATEGVRTVYVYYHPHSDTLSEAARLRHAGNRRRTREANADRTRGRRRGLALLFCPPFALDTPPLGISYLSRYLRAHSIPTLLLDLNGDFHDGAPEDARSMWEANSGIRWCDRERFEEMVRVLSPQMDRAVGLVASSRVKVAGFSVNYFNMMLSLEVASRLKRAAPEIKVVFGGPEIYWRAEAGHHPRAFFDNVNADARYGLELVDAFVGGEGEGALLDIARRALEVVDRRPHVGQVERAAPEREALRVATDLRDGPALHLAARTVDERLEPRISGDDAGPPPDEGERLLALERRHLAGEGALPYRYLREHPLEPFVPLPDEGLVGHFGIQFAGRYPSGLHEELLFEFVRPPAHHLLEDAFPARIGDHQEHDRLTDRLHGAAPGAAHSSGEDGVRVSDVLRRQIPLAIGARQKRKQFVECASIHISPLGPPPARLVGNRPRPEAVSPETAERPQGLLRLLVD